MDEDVVRDLGALYYVIMAWAREPTPTSAMMTLGTWPSS